MSKYQLTITLSNLYKYLQEVFYAFHKEFDKVDKYSKLYLIGKVKPTDEIEDKFEREKILKEDEIRKDFVKVKQTAVKMVGFVWVNF